ncbi:MAG: PLDc N-terminal domain-containing protein [Nitriliruptoraceae bacterium]
MDIPFAAVAPLVLVAIGFIVYCLVDLHRTERVQGLPRWGWAIAIVASVPVGGLVYLLWGRRA